MPHGQHLSPIQGESTLQGTILSQKNELFLGIFWGQFFFNFI
jgi:hypothetical protein